MNGFCFCFGLIRNISASCRVTYSTCRLVFYEYYALQLSSLDTSLGARCSSVVRVMGRRMDPSCDGPIELFLVPACAPRLV